MSYFQSPALLRHQLDSILPYQIKLYESKPLLKTRQFYKPQQFIWNNPHRTSDNVYKFYHKYNEHYQKVKAPLIQKVQSEERQQRKIDRIRKLSQVRQQTRKRFLNRQKDRETLELLSGTRDDWARQYYNYTTAGQRFSTISHYHSKPSKYEPMIPDHIKSKIPLRKSNSLVKNIQQTYLTGVERDQIKTKQIQQLIVNQTHKQQNKVRVEFEKQKQNNSKKISRISKFDVSKLDIKSVYKKFQQ